MSPKKAEAPTLQVIAHRGAGTIAPENTLAAIRMAMSLGVEGIECDVQCSQDGEAVLLHDTTLDRTTNGTGAVKDYSATELQQLDAGSWFDATSKGERVPTLRELLHLVNGQTRIYLDVREIPIVDCVMERLVGAQATGWCTVISFSEEVLARCLSKQPEIPRTLLIHPDPNIPLDVTKLISRLTAHTIHMVGLPPQWVTTDLLHQAHDAHIQVLTGPLDDKEQIAETLSLHPDFALTNRPDLLMEYVRTEDR